MFNPTTRKLYLRRWPIVRLSQQNQHNQSVNMCHHVPYNASGARTQTCHSLDINPKHVQSSHQPNTVQSSHQNKSQSRGCFKPKYDMYIEQLALQLTRRSRYCGLTRQIGMTNSHAVSELQYSTMVCIRLVSLPVLGRANNSPGAARKTACQQCDSVLWAQPTDPTGAGAWADLPVLPVPPDMFVMQSVQVVCALARGLAVPTDAEGAPAGTNVISKAGFRGSQKQCISGYSGHRSLVPDRLQPIN